MASAVFSSKNNISVNYPVVLNKITLRYQDRGPAKPRESNLIFDTDLDELEEDKYQHGNNDNLNEQIIFEEKKTIFNNKKGNKKGNRDKVKEFTLEKSLNRLSLLKFREHLEENSGVNLNNNHSSQSKRNLKVNSLVAEIVPLIAPNNRDTLNLTPNIYNEYYDQDASSVPNNKSLPQASVTPLLPKVNIVNRSQSFNTPRNNLSRTSTQIPATPIAQALPRPFTNQITQKSKVFNLVYGINNKFVQKYLPNDLSKKGEIYRNEKLPGHLALYKLMRETKTILNQTNSTDLERIRKEILSRNSLNPSQYNNIEECLSSSSPRIEEMSPTNFTFNKSTLKKNFSIHENLTARRSKTSNYIINQATEASVQVNNSNSNSSMRHHSESVMAYLTHLGPKDK
jgi:hypothetical protein